MLLHATYTTEDGEAIDLEGESLEELSLELPPDYQGQIEVFNEPGFTFGWLLAHGKYQNA